MYSLFQWLRAFFWPGFVLLLCAIGLIQSDYAPTEVTTAWRSLPWLLMLCATVLGIRFNRSRVAFSAILCALVTAMLLRTPIQRDLTAVGLGVGLCFFSMIQERGFLTRASLSRWAYLALLFFTAIFATKESLSFLSHDFGIQVPSNFSLSTLLVLLASGCFLMIRSLILRQSTECSLLAVLILVSMSLNGSPKSIEACVYLSAAASILVLTLIETSHKLAYCDELTGLPARRALQEHMAKLGPNYTLAMLDIDHFKKFNDTYGHDAGDEVLRMVAGLLAQVTGGGRAFRYGGEEFTIVFSGKNAEEAFEHLDALREKIADTPFIPRAPDRPAKKPKSTKPTKKAKNPKAVQVTVSMGASTHERGQTPDEVLKAADKNLYFSKENGRNQVTI